MYFNLCSGMTFEDEEYPAVAQLETTVLPSRISTSHAGPSKRSSAAMEASPAQVSMSSSPARASDADSEFEDYAGSY